MDVSQEIRKLQINPSTALGGKDACECNDPCSDIFIPYKLYTRVIETTFKIIVSYIIVRDEEKTTFSHDVMQVHKK